MHVESGTIHSIHRQQQAKRTVNPEGLKATWVPHLGTKIPEMRPKFSTIGRIGESLQVLLVPTYQHTQHSQATATETKA